MSSRPTMAVPRPLPALALIALVLLCLPLPADEPVNTRLTWSGEISRLLGARCMGCHQPGGAAPFSLASYADARPWAVAIRDEVAARRMPPWNAVRGFGRFSPDHSLTQEEILLLTAWVNGGAPEGDPRLLNPTMPNLHSAPPIPAGTPLRAADRLGLPAGTISGLRILHLPAHSETRLLLQHPSGRLQPLAWLRSLSPHAPATYRFAEPVTVPAGSFLRLWGPPGARLELYSSPSPNPTPAPE